MSCFPNRKLVLYFTHLRQLLPTPSVNIFLSCLCLGVDYGFAFLDTYLEKSYLELWEVDKWSVQKGHPVIIQTHSHRFPARSVRVGCVIAMYGLELFWFRYPVQVISVFQIFLGLLSFVVQGSLWRSISRVIYSLLIYPIYHTVTYLPLKLLVFLVHLRTLLLLYGLHHCPIHCFPVPRDSEATFHLVLNPLL